MTDTILVLNAAEGRVQTLLLREGDILCFQDWSAPSRGTELLTPLLADAFQRTGVAPADIGRIACVAGPGSFTGIRLALATAAALRRATGARLAPINALQALAAGLPPALLARGGIRRIRVLTHARRGLTHGQDFLPAEPSQSTEPPQPPHPIGEPAMLLVEGALSDPAPDLVIGSGVARNLDFLREHAPRGTLILPGVCEQPTPAALAAVTLALPETAWRDADIEPMYLRPCDAVDNLSSIAAKRGDDPAQAHAELRRLLNTSPERL